MRKLFIFQIALLMLMLTYSELNGQCTFSQSVIDIDGETGGSRSGASVSLSSDGLTLAIGANQNPGGGTRRGHVRVYKLINGTWTQQGDDIDGDNDEDQSGYSVSLSSDGSVVAVGAPENSGGGKYRGQVKVYKLISGIWVKQGEDIKGESDFDKSGTSVSLSADGLVIAVGAPSNSGGGMFRGHVRIYKLVSGTWIQQGSDINGETDYNFSGWSVSLSADGSVVAIGAPGNTGLRSQKGQVRVFKMISGTWSRLGANIVGEEDGDNSGFSVSLSADGLSLAIGAPSNTGGDTFRGHVRVFKLISGTWSQQGSDIDGDVDWEATGRSVSISSDGLKVAIGAPNAHGGGLGRGHTRVYRLISGNWIKQDGDINGESDWDESGWSVALSADGSTVAIGAPNNREDNLVRGQVRVYMCATTTKKNSFHYQAINIYPNPFNSIIHVQTPYLLNGEFAQIYLTDFSGKTVHSLKTNKTQNPIDLSHLPQGVYQILIIVNNKNLISKIVKCY